MATDKKRALREVKYTCKCGNVQTLRYWGDESILPATCCVQCRAGFNNNIGYGEMASIGMGMLPGKPLWV